MSGNLEQRVSRLGAVLLATVLCVFLLSACSSTSSSLPNLPTELDLTRIAADVEVLASDEFEGRAPGTAGEEKTLDYLVSEFTKIGLAPGGNNDSWTQTVPLVHTRLPESAVVEVVSADGELSKLKQGIDIAFETTRAVGELRIDRAPIVFVGYGASAPERNWDDFGDIDLTNKIAIFLVNDPDFYAAADEPVAGLFGEKRMTYYGRWTYKFEEAARRGALGALVIHETAAAGYGWNVASSSPGESYAGVPALDAQPAVLLQGWLHENAAVDLLGAAGFDFEQLKEQARAPEFEAFELTDMHLSADLQVALERINSKNLLARLDGSRCAAEIIMVSAHWDAYGIGAPDAAGRVVRPGANDDALGVAGVLELARVLKAGEPLERSVVFALWTAEESGLIGSKAYADQPVYPLELTVANLTLDILQTAGPARDVILVGEGRSELEESLMRAAAAQGRTLTPESLPENGLFFRADHFSLAREGVPVLLLMGIAGAADLVDGGREAGAAWIDDYIGNCYHQTCDQIDDRWDLRGAAQDIDLYLQIVRELGNSDRWPQWYAASEFKAKRDAAPPPATSCRD